MHKKTAHQFKKCEVLYKCQFGLSVRKTLGRDSNESLVFTERFFKRALIDIWHPFDFHKGFQYLFQKLNYHGIHFYDKKLTS